MSSQRQERYRFGTLSDKGVMTARVVRELRFGRTEEGEGDGVLPRLLSSCDTLVTHQSRHVAVRHGEQNNKNRRDRQRDTHAGEHGLIFLPP